MSDLIVVSISYRVLHFLHKVHFVIFFDQFLLTRFLLKFVKFLYLTSFIGGIKNLTVRKVGGIM